MTPAENPARAPRWEWWLALAATLAAAALHAHFFLHVGGLWRDEVNMANLARQFDQVGLTHDSFPVLFACVVRCWAAVFGWGDAALRSLGLAIGLGIIGALWLAAWTSRRRPPLLGVAIFGLNSIVISYGDSIRAYGLGSLLIVLLAAAAWALAQKPSWLRAVIFAVLAIFAAQALYQNAVLIAAICLGAWTVCLRKNDFAAALKFLPGAILSAASLLPYRTNIVHDKTVVAGLFTGLDIPETLTNLDTALGYPFEQFTFAWALLAVLVIALAALAWRTADAQKLFAGVTLVGALAGFAWFLWVAAFQTQPWHFLPLLALVAACFDFGLPLDSKKFRAPLLGFALATVAVAVPFAQRDLRWRFTSIDLLAEKLSAEAAPGDFILVTPWYGGITFQRYFHGATPWTTLPPLAEHSFHHLGGMFGQMQTPHALQPVFAQIDATLKSGHRVWVVGWMDVPPPGVPLAEDLPPPPLKSTGWSDTPYSLRWTSQTAQLLSNHSLRFARADRPGQLVNFEENFTLLTADGWRP